MPLRTLLSLIVCSRNCKPYDLLLKKRAIIKKILNLSRRRKKPRYIKHTLKIHTKMSVTKETCSVIYKYKNQTDEILIVIGLLLTYKLTNGLLIPKLVPYFMINTQSSKTKMSVSTRSDQ